MIKIIKGDLFDTNAKFICHQVNCAGKMESGVALQVRQKYPHVYKEYKKVASEDMLGEVQIIPVNSKFIGHEPGDIWCGMKVKGFRETQWICNLFAQKSYGYDGKQYTSNEALRQCFKKLAGMVHEKNNNFGQTIAMPYKIGCCRGGSDWSDVANIIEEEFKDCNVELWRL